MPKMTAPIIRIDRFIKPHREARGRSLSPILLFTVVRKLSYQMLKMDLKYSPQYRKAIGAE